jgi:hypothetical protein
VDKFAWNHGKIWAGHRTDYGTTTEPLAILERTLVDRWRLDGCFLPPLILLDVHSWRI